MAQCIRHCGLRQDRTACLVLHVAWTRGLNWTRQGVTPPTAHCRQNVWQHADVVTYGSAYKLERDSPSCGMLPKHCA